MSHSLPLDPSSRADDPQTDAARNDGTHEITPDLAYKRLVMVNVVFYGLPGEGDRKWVLIDAGIPGSLGSIVEAASERFGEGTAPSAIILTHGHIDHIGALKGLAERWDTPIYAHEWELPYLNGSAAYPPPDPTVGGGVMSMLSPLFPRGPIDVSSWLHALPADGSVPEMPGWKWIFTPGHSVGHVSFWRDADRTVIAGDAFITTAQESAYAVATQRMELHGPPMYFTQNWEQAKESVARLSELQPDLAITGHGRAMRGPALKSGLQTLAEGFDRIAVPAHGHYVTEPTRAEDGSAYEAVCE